MDRELTKRTIYSKKIISAFSSVLHSTTGTGSFKENSTDLFSRLKNIFPITIIASLALLASCSDKEVKEPEEYKGPLEEAENDEVYYSEDDHVKMKMNADLVYEFQNGDREFPKGIFLENYDIDGKLVSTLRADHAYYFKEQDQWRGRGKVEVRNVDKKEQLNTEELFWKPAEQRIFTDKFVTIRQQTDVLYGKGLTAKQDMSDYTIIKPEGEFEIEDQ